jgi:hypothetical protein
VPHLSEFYPGICLTPEEKARINLSQGKKSHSQLQMKKYSPKDARRKEIILKNKLIHIQSWIDPEDSRMLKLPDFKTIGS